MVFATGRGSPRWPSSVRRMPGPSLRRKNVPSAAKERPNMSGSESPDAVDDPVHERRDRLGRGLLHGGGGAGRARRVDAGVLQPALELVDACGGLRRELRALARDTRDHDHDDEDRDRRDPDQDESRRERARHVPVEERDERHRHDRDDERADHRPDDRVRLGEQPDEADDEQEHPDEQPGAPAEVAQPPRRAEGLSQFRASRAAGFSDRAHPVRLGRKNCTVAESLTTAQDDKPPAAAGAGRARGAATSGS